MTEVDVSQKRCPSGYHPMALFSSSPPLRLQSRPSPADFCSDPCPEPVEGFVLSFRLRSHPPVNKADRSVFDGRCKSLFRHMLLPVNRCQPDYIRLDYSSSSSSFPTSQILPSSHSLSMLPAPSEPLCISHGNSKSH